MPRTPRNDTPGSFHHVMNGAVGQRPFFDNRRDIRKFLARLAETVRAGDLEIHAYSILSTHFHLLVRSPRGKLSEAIGCSECEYVRAFNARRKRPGPLVRNRFNSKRVDCLAYFSNVIRYIDANAVDAGLVRVPGEYPFASAGIYAGRRTPPWLERSTVESVTCRVTSQAAFSPTLYTHQFGTGPSAAEKLATERAIGSVRRARLSLGPVAGAHPIVRARFADNAKRADGTEIELPVIDADSIDAAVDAVAAIRGTIEPTRGARAVGGWELIRIGLLRELAGATDAELAAKLQWTRSRVRDWVHRFRLELDRDAVMRSLVEEVLRRLPSAWSEPVEPDE